MKFSERKGYLNLSTLIQTEGMSDELRISLWNILFLSRWNIASANSDYKFLKIHTDIENFSSLLSFNYFKKPIDSRPDNFTDMLQEIRNYFMQCQWHEVYDFLEFTLNFYNDEELTEFVNAVLERELSGYRFVNGIITDITDPQEVEMLESVLEDNDFPAVKAHLHRALDLLSNKKSPDYRNSIKESISAVESLARVLSGNTKATLGDALKVMEKKGIIHPSLKEAFSKLYGYTNDEGGIRHAMLNEPNLSAADAKFFLLSCTNFINYLKSKV
jgi:hypothetical protein